VTAAGEQVRDESKRVRVFDTTLRDGEQSPGITLNTREKLEIAHQLRRLGVDVIEAGFPITSPGDFEAVRAIAQEVPDVTVDAVRLARSIVDDVEFSCEDATRSDPAFVAEVIGAAIAEGASTINIPDTVGYTMPTEFQRFLMELYERCPALHDVTLSVHCHNDLGLAVANSLAGAQVGARQVEGCVNGIGERAGNASIEELAMILRTRAEDLGGLWCGVDTTEITRASRLVSRLTGYVVQPNKAVVGRNAFAHEAGIHQHGVLANPLTYEIMDATSVGLAQNSIVLGKHSGRHALAHALTELGYQLDRDELDQAFVRFKEVADLKGRISAADLEALVSDEMRAEGAEGVRLQSFTVRTGTGETPQAHVVVAEDDGTPRTGTAGGDGPIDALMKAIDAAVGTAGTLLEYHVDAVTGGKDALGEARVVCSIGGRTVAGQGVSTDVLEASAIAYLRAVNASRRAEQGERVAAGGV